MFTLNINSLRLLKTSRSGAHNWLKIHMRPALYRLGCIDIYMMTHTHTRIAKYIATWININS